MKRKVVVVIGLLLCVCLCACGKEEKKKEDGFFVKVKDWVFEEVKSAASHKMLKFIVNKKLDSTFTVESSKGNTVTFAYSDNWEQDGVSIEDGSTYYTSNLSEVSFSFGDEYASGLGVAVIPINDYEVDGISLDSSSSLEEYETVLNSVILETGINVADKTTIFLDEGVNMPCVRCKLTTQIDEENNLNFLLSAFATEDVMYMVMFTSVELDYEEMEKMYSNFLNSIKIDVGYSLDF